MEGWGLFICPDQQAWPGAATFGTAAGPTLRGLRSSCHHRTRERRWCRSIGTFRPV